MLAEPRLRQHGVLGGDGGGEQACGGGEIFGGDSGSDYDSGFFDGVRVLWMWPAPMSLHASGRENSSPLLFSSPPRQKWQQEPVPQLPSHQTSVFSDIWPCFSNVAEHHFCWHDMSSCKISKVVSL
ncbi:MAG TPA: hypothetical protein VFU49_08710 [Ktedonobacteraceae bacterium]|nr:hypothetical protein [Ktedonobacteraceae bacterium]